MFRIQPARITQAYFRKIMTRVKKKQALELLCEESHSATANSENIFRKYLKWNSFLYLHNAYIFFVENGSKIYLIILLFLHPYAN